MRTTDDLLAFMREQELDGEILRLEVETPTVEKAAEAVGTSPQQIVKSLLFLVEGEPVLVIAAGTQMVDLRAIAEYFQVGKKRVELADPTTVLEITGYPVGAMPPFGHRQTLNTIMDPAVLQQEQVYAGGGAIAALLRVDPHQILQVTGADVLPLTRQERS